MIGLLPIVALLAIGIPIYTYFVYPVLVWGVSKLLGRTERPADLGDEALPFVSLLVAAHNEEAWIGERVRNALALDYPADRFEIVIASDGSTDRTNEIVSGFDDDRVRLLDYSPNRGKSAVLNASVPQLKGEIVVFSDANTMFEPDAVRKLVRWFADSRIGVVCGKLVLTDSATGRNVDRMYWRYESFVKQCEARLGALLGANGAIYAMRRAFYVPIPDNTIIDDFVIPLAGRIEHGFRAVYDAEARAEEEVPETIRDEFKRRARIGTGGYQSLSRLWPLLAPWRGWVAVAFLSHKVLRWLSPICLATALVTCALLWNHLAFRVLFLAQVAFYALALVGNWVQGRSLVARLFRAGTLFCGMNAALAVGLWRWLFVPQSGTWKRTERGT